MRGKEWRDANQDGIKKYRKEYYQKNRKALLEISRKHKLENRAYYRQKDYEFARSPKGKFKVIKNNAKSRNLLVEFSLDQYMALITDARCYYCSGPLPEAGGGLDRLNNSIGYRLDNVVPCCDFCNDLRGNLLTPDETKVAVKAIQQFRLNRILNENGQEVK